MPIDEPTAAGPRHRKGLFPRWLYWGIGAVGLVACAVLWDYSTTAETEIAQIRFEADAALRIEAVERHLGAVTVSVSDIANALSLRTPITTAYFKGLAQPVLEREPTLQALSWNPIVPAVDRERHEAAIREGGTRDYRITESDASGTLVRASERADYVVVQTILPIVGNESALGFDVASEPKRRVALAASRDDRRVRATAPLTLVQESGDQQAVLVFAPVSGDDYVIGFVVAVLRMGDVVAAALSGFEIDMGIRIVDVDAPGAGGRLFTSTTNPPAELAAYMVEFEYATRPWAVTLNAGKSYAPRKFQPLLLAFGTGALTLLFLAGAHVQSNASLRQEIFERNEIAEALRKSQTRLADIIDIAADAIISIDPAQKIVLFNKEAETIFGYSADEVMGQSLDVLIPPELRVDHREHVTTFKGSTTSARRRMGERVGVQGLRNNGQLFPAEATISKIEAGGQQILTAVLRDVSERKQAEETLRQQHRELAHVLRTATMSELTAALAHELNQPLTAILSNAQTGKRFLSTETPDLHEIGEILDDIIDDDQRAAEVIRHMRTLMSKHDADTQPLEVNAVIGDVMRLIHSDSVTKRVVVDLDLAEGLPLVPGDPIQLQQVCLNLILNGFDAMQDVPVDERRLVIQTALQGNEAVCVSIRDTGIGFSRSDADRLFEPFHTTKAAGLGMGLSISRSIIQAHGGEIWACENSDRGATFQFTLPLISDE